MSTAPAAGFNTAVGDIEFSDDLTDWVSFSGEGVSVVPTGGEDEVATQQTVLGRHPIVSNSDKHAPYTLTITLVWGKTGSDYETIRAAREGANKLAVRWAYPDFAAAGNPMVETAGRDGANLGLATITRLDFPKVDAASNVQVCVLVLQCPALIEGVTPTPAVALASPVGSNRKSNE